METDEPAPSQTEAAFPKADKRAINKSITPDALIPFIDGKPYKTLKRHLSGYGMDTAAYREMVRPPEGLSFGGPELQRRAVGDGKILGAGRPRPLSRWSGAAARQDARAAAACSWSRPTRSGTCRGRPTRPPP